MKSLRQMLAIVLMTLSLSGCDMELYSGLSEGGGQSNAGIADAAPN